MTTLPVSTWNAAADQALAASRRAAADHETLRNALTGQHGVLPGVALVEHQLQIAKRAAPEDALFGLVGHAARLHHEAAMCAYQRSLKMVSSNFLRRLASKVAAVPGTDAELAEQNQWMINALFGQYGVSGGADSIERSLAVATRAEHEDTPFPLSAEEAAIWHNAQKTAYLYVLEMLCTDRLKKLGANFPLPATSAVGIDPNDEPAAAPTM